MSKKPKPSVVSFCLCSGTLGNLAVSILLLIFVCGWAQAEDGQQGALLICNGSKGEIILMEPDGSNPRILVNLPAYYVAWSPDSQHIAFAGPDVFISEYDGSNLSNLTNQGALCRDVCWSPDGSRIAFSSKMTGDWDVYVIGSDGQELVNLSSHPAEDRKPTWSPDGQQLAFDSKRDGQWDIYLVGADGGNLKNLTNHPAFDRYSAWSPVDSSQIAFITDRNGNDALYLIDPKEQDPMLLYQHEAPGPDYMYPVWSPDGSQILLLLDLVMTSTYVVEVASGAARRITGGHVDYGLQWSPDGQYIAFARQFFGPGLDEIKMATNGVYIMRPDGTGLTCISSMSMRSTLDWGMPPSSHSTSVLPRLPTSWGQIKGGQR